MGSEESNNNLPELLKPFHQRASEAEDRLAKLEAVVAKGVKGSGNEEELKLIKELQSKLDIAGAERVAENKKNKKVMEEMESLKTENAKLKYRIIHLIRAVKEGDAKLERFKQGDKS